MHHASGRTLDRVHTSRVRPKELRPIMIVQRYPEHFIAPMREELTALGFEELRTPADVDQAVSRPGTTLLVVNSVCGCAAGKARPGIAMALRHAARPGPSHDGVRGRRRGSHHACARPPGAVPPSSPAIALLKDGKIAFMLERRDIEGRPAELIAAALTAAFDEHCAG